MVSTLDLGIKFSAGFRASQEGGGLMTLALCSLHALYIGDSHIPAYSPTDIGSLIGNSVPEITGRRAQTVPTPHEESWLSN